MQRFNLGEDIRSLKQDRYHRQKLIPWWDQERVRNARILVVGAGALGNEILKLLSLTGIGRVLVYDMDVIEQSNLSRSVLFREYDEGDFKAEVAARRMRELNQAVLVGGRSENIMERAGLGIFLWADVIIGGVDNRSARIFINNACAQTGRTWVDGAIEGLAGVIRVFDPIRTACYECTMNETDRRSVQQRMSCAMLARDVVSSGHVPTTAVTASIIAALQVQEAIKFLHDQPTLAGEGIHTEGLWGEFSRVTYPRREACAAHAYSGPFVPLGLSITDLSLQRLLDRADSVLGPGAVLELSRDVVFRLDCLGCGRSEPRGTVLGFVREAEARCPVCGTHRSILFTSVISRDGDVDLTLTLAEIGVPLFDIVVARQGLEASQAWLFDGDMATVLGSLATPFDPQQLSRPVSERNSV